MAKNGTAWKPVQVQTQTAIHGGVGRKHHVLALERFEFEGGEVSFVLVSPQEGWLCEVVAGQCSSRRPLTRSDIFRRLRLAFTPEVADSICDVVPQDDRMQDLGFEDSPSSSQSPPAKAHKRSRGKSYKGVVVRKITIPANPPAVPAVASNVGQAAVAANREVLAAIKMNKLFLEIDALSWLVCFLRHEFEAGFVADVVSGPASVEEIPGGPNLWWDFRDECWVCRERPMHSDDKRRRQRKSVRSRMAQGCDLHHMTFEAAKAFCHKELADTFEIDEAPAVAAGLPLAAGECVTAVAAMS
jgi:hypothetical protein